jgi:hypothetical protein
MSRDKQMLPTYIFLSLRPSSGKESLLEKILLEFIVKKEEAKKGREGNLI